MDRERRHFILRRLHSLSGVVPVGAFVAEHFYTNAFAIKGPELFNEKVAALNNLPYLYLLEIFLIGLPIVFHAALGIAISFEGSVSVGRYGFWRNWMYLLQRATGFFLVVFIAVHVWLTRLSGTAPDRLFEHMAAYLAQPGMFAFYAAGVLAVSFHLGNGLWGFMVSWGITTSARSQRIMTWVSLGIFGVMGFVGINSLLGFLGSSVGLFNR
jgi:succinate dehydrogenase / fumarate reductase cytochrome b subunit